MKCLKCRSKTQITNSRLVDNHVTRRRHQCLSCSMRFSTVEVPVSLFKKVKEPIGALDAFMKSILKYNVRGES